jgi:hypothetical protein
MEEEEPTPEKKPRFTKEERLARLVDDAVNISDRFAREPVLARTGKGYYKSAGVEGLKQDIAYLKSLESREQPR